MRKLAAILALTFAFTGIGGVANAAPAEAATWITGNCYRQWVSAPVWPGLPYKSVRLNNEYCWKDFTWSEEFYNGSRDGYYFYRTVSRVLVY